jgi:hypothetical protein
MTLRIIDCKATPNSIKVLFSDAVNVVSDPSNPALFASSAANVNNYAIVENSSGGPIFVSLNQKNITPIRDGHGIVLTPGTQLLTGSSIVVTVQNIRNESGSDGLPHQEGSKDPPQDFSVAIVNGQDNEEKEIRRIARVAEDSFAFPQLSEEVGFAPSPLARLSSVPSGGGTAALGQTVTQAISDVLGWKIKSDDSKGFVGALNASFSCSDVDGHTECKWTPRTYAVQTDLSGGITGAQASLYSRAQDALNQSLPLLDGLYPLDPEADAEDVAALKGIARSQLTELVNELGMAGGPRVSRINQYFKLLLQNPEESFPPSPGSQLITDPDQIHGILGKLRDQLGLNFTTQDFANTVQDEQDITNFRILSDYVTSLAQSWLNNLRFFGLDTSTPFFGTQLVLLSRQLSVVAEAVDEVRFTLDSVFIGPAERQTLQLQFPGVSTDSLFAEDLFNWVQNFATEEGPRLIQDGGKFGVKFSFLPIAQQLQRLVESAHDPDPLDHAFRTIRVRRAFGQLGRELNELVKLAKDVSHVIEEEPTKADFDAMRQQLGLLTVEVGNLVPTPQIPPAPTLVGIPPQLAFASQAVRTESAPQPTTIFNVVSGSARIASIQSVDDTSSTSAPSDFKVLEPDIFPIVLAGSETLAVTVVFTPTDAKLRTAILRVIYNGDDPNQQKKVEIKLSGTGITEKK